MNQVFQIVTDRILQMMDQGRLAWVKNWQARKAGYPQNYVSKKRYRGVNFLFLASLPFDNPYYLSFKQVQDLGGHVKKGEKATPVIFWKLSKYENSKPDGTTEDKKSLILRYYNVFNIDQTEGINFKLQKQIEKKPHEKIEQCEKIVSSMPQPPAIEYNDRDRACYNKVKDLVTMPELGYFDTPAAFYSTLFHELAHSTGHKNRLNRAELEHISRFGDENYSKEELTAELASAFLCAETGISNEDNLRNNAAYLQGWSKALKGDPKLFVYAAARAQKAANFILGIKEPEFETENN